MNEKEIKGYKNALPKGETIEALMTKGKPIEMLSDARMNLSKLDKGHFEAWKKDPSKAVSDGHDPTQYEELMAVGYDSSLHELMGIVYLKLPYGYGGSCPSYLGSIQYVRFYIDLTGDGDFLDPMEDQGSGMGHVFDPESVNQNKLPLEYGISRRMILLPSVMDLLEKKCEIKRMRAIFSWNVEPPGGNPNWIPYWGNVLNTWIRFHR
jgi:hypothetical protein